MNPLVSICIPTYNGKKFIAEALNSALAQTYRPLEIILSDDASTDATLDIVNTYISKTDIPFYIHHHTPNGIGSNWNNCVKQARGKYIKFLFQDDVLEPNCIDLMVTAAESNKNIGLVYCKRTILFNCYNKKETEWVANYGILHESYKSLKIKQGAIPGETLLSDECLLKRPLNKIGEPTAVLIKRSCFNKVGYFKEDLHQVLDVEFWYRLMPYYYFAFLDKALVGFRLHDSQATKVNSQRTRAIKIKEKRLLEKMLFLNCFRYLNSKVRWQLFKNLTKLSKVVINLQKIKNRLFLRW